METNKVLSALSYFSVLFAGFLFPLVVYFVTEDQRVKYHAKKALLSHLIPLIPVPFIFIGIFLDINSSGEMEFPAISFLAMIISIILSLIVLIWNIIKGVKVLRNE
ncbi:DUF4870 domain-containing protein [Neobacillus sp. D3-1R]|uniref:DUF4870 domain-containing protein n=1 Tax=Neobacillus sp. D3-1R TaxID=3445778 RepID=UPI003FA030A0